MVIWITLPVAVVLGFLAGLGVGGGSLLMLWLTFVIGIEQDQARVINLLFFLPSAGIATIFHHKQGTVQIKKIQPAILTGCIAAVCFSFVRQYIDINILKKCFGVLLLMTGIKEVFYRPRKAR